MSSTTVCLTDTSVIPFPTLESSNAQASNAAASSSHRTVCSSSPLAFSDVSISDSTASDPSDGADYAIQNPSENYVRYDSGSSSSSSTPSDEICPTILPRSKRVPYQHSASIHSRDIFDPVTPASTPAKPLADARSFTDLEGSKQTPLLCNPSDEEDTVRPFPVLKRSPFCKVGKLRLQGSAAKHVRQTSDLDVTPSRPSVPESPYPHQSPQTIRKKSGQPIKSSLKSTRRPELHVVTNGSLAKSEPATPTQTKAVHFDSKLEHVKLFLAEQKPLAVSRDGSPTSDTSGDEFPSFIYGDASRDNKRVKMLVPNMPLHPKKAENVALQELILSQDQRTITGHVRVRNIAYEKWLAIRFTLDWWQTTSEVTARYDKSIEGGAFDVFTFNIRLHDIWSRIGEKTIFIALRYTVAGQEYWDNNAGKNYHLKFAVIPPTDSSSAVDNDTGLKDLNTKLQDLAKTRSSPIPVTPYRLGRSFSADYQYSSFAKPSSSRYDFANAYKHLKNPPPKLTHHRTHTYPSGVPATAGPTVAPYSQSSEADETEEVESPPRPQSPPLSVGPPREVMDTPPARSETKQISPDSPSAPRLQDGRERNHRRGFTDRAMEASPTLRRTPPGSPLKYDATLNDVATQLPRTRSLPLMPEKQGSTVPSVSKPPLSIQINPANDGNSEEPTPYGSSQSSSSSDSSNTSLVSPGSDVPRNDTSYKQFIDQFCFYTGGDPFLQESSEGLPRSYSTSRIEDYLSSHSPPSSVSRTRDLHVRFPFSASNGNTPRAVHV